MCLTIFSNLPWIDVFWILISAVFILVGLAGCIIPVIPGPPLSYFGLLLLQLISNPPFSLKFMIVLAIITIIVTIVDYLVPLWGAKKFGATKYGISGSMIGLILSFFFFSPLSIFLFPFIGALIGELIAGKKGIFAFKASLGVFFGFFFGTVIKVVLSGYMFFEFIKVIII